MRWAARLGCGALVLASAHAARADAPSKEQCINAYQGAQIDMKKSALGAAREKLAVCLAEGCPRALQADCAEWLKEVDTRQPSVVLSFTGEEGADVAGVSVQVDGKVAAHTDGRAVNLDPGEHTFVFTHAGEAAVTVRAVVREGERAQRIVGVSTRYRPPSATPLRAAKPAAPVATHRPIPWPVWALGGLGLGAMGSFAGNAISGMSAKSDLDACKPSCPSDDVSSVRVRFIVADVSLVVGTLALAGAAAFYLTRPEVPVRPSGVTFTGSGVRGVF